MQRKKKEEERNGFSLYHRFRSLRKLKNHNFLSVSDSANMLFLISATSSGREFSLGQTSGGRCSTHNMRFIIYVCRDTNGKIQFLYDAITLFNPGSASFQTRPQANSRYSNERRRLKADERDVTCVVTSHTSEPAEDE